MAGVVKEFDGEAVSPVALRSVFESARDQSAFDDAFASLAPAERARLQEIEDLNAGQAGLANGRLALGGYGRASGYAEGSGRRKGDKNAIDPLTLTDLLTNAQYSALHDSAISLFHNTANEIEDTIAELHLAHAETLARIEDMTDSAMRDSEGRLVFNDGDKLVYANGDELVLSEAASVIRKDGAPSYQEWRAANDKADFLALRILEITQMRDERLSPLHVELTDENNPPAPERIEEIKREMDDIVRDARTSAEFTPTAEVREDVTVYAKPSVEAIPAV